MYREQSGPYALWLVARAERSGRDGGTGGVGWRTVNRLALATRVANVTGRGETLLALPR
ncbi:hypothetical protein AB4039_11625 [Streptomyces sp. M-16]|uniref:hypothetical protein n=1 Tax=Streptomyces sp. M-16 TaxID=3233040 RepID=UPI00225B8A33